MKKLKVKVLLRKLRDAVVSGYVKNRKWHFCTGIIFSLIGLLFLLRFGIGLGTWVFLGIGFINLAIWLLVKWHLYKLDQTCLKDKNAESHNI